MMSGRRQYDLASRIGGDEFALVLGGCGPAHAPTLAEEVRSAVEGPFTLESGLVIEIAASVGHACLPSDASDLLGLLDAADQRMYADKRRRKAVSALITSAQHLTHETGTSPQRV